MRIWPRRKEFAGPGTPASSSVRRIAPTLPSIMSLGAITSQPASACTNAWRHSTATVSSLTIAPSRSRPSWPWLVNGSSATSHITPISGTARLIAETARQTRFSGFAASSPSGVLSAGSVTGKTATIGIPSAAASPTASTRRGIVNRYTPGNVPTSTLSSGPSWTKTGQIRSSMSSRVSATSRRFQSV